MHEKSPEELFDPEKKENNSDVASSSSSSSCLSDSFKSLVENRKKPFIQDYNAFATTYICQEIPFPRIFCDGENPSMDIKIPFSNPVPLQKYSVAEKQRGELGLSVRKQKLDSKKAQVIIDEISAANKEFQDQKLRTIFLFLKARQWCELNKALAVDEKYPKPDPNIISRKFSLEHQKAMKGAREQIGLHKKKPIFERDRRIAPCHIPGEPAKVDISKESQPIPMVAAAALKLKKKSDIVKAVEKIFEDIKPLAGLATRKQPWQFEAVKSLTAKPIVKKKGFWKKNVYPPMSREEVIAEMRKKLPRPKPDHLQTDYLSGIWDAALMSEQFQITPKNYDSRIEISENVMTVDPINWHDMRKAKAKCAKWLKNIPNSL